MNKWFDRKFANDTPPELLPGVIERLRGTPARIAYRASGVDPKIMTAKSGDSWSIQEHIGHLLDLEELWLGRLEDFANGMDTLREADLANKKTRDANHNESTFETLLLDFQQERHRIVTHLESLSDSNLVKTAMHPRLKSPMRIIDLCVFVAEHDDHHLAHITALLNNA